MDISQNTNIEHLESLAYQQIKALNQAQANLNVIEDRLRQLRAEPQPGEADTTLDAPNATEEK